MVRHLAESDNYKVTSEFEYVRLHFKNNYSKQPVYIGDFYGDPDCAIISADEKYTVVGGCGLIIYKLEEPFKEYTPTQTLSQFSEFFREPGNVWWIKNLHQPENNNNNCKTFRFEASNNEGEFIYEMNAESFGILKITAT